LTSGNTGKLFPLLVLSLTVVDRSWLPGAVRYRTRIARRGHQLIDGAGSGKEAAMADLPADVRDCYRRLAEARRWPHETEAAFLRTAVWFLTLDERPGARDYYERADEDGLAEPGTRWLWETVIVNGAITAVKQIEIPLHGPVRRYWWRWLEDDASGLTDQPLVPDEDGLHPITREAFYQAWDSRTTA
jgi:hypothetical protein